MTVEQLEAARAERLRLDGRSVLTLEDARTWIEETGLCLFLPRPAQNVTGTAQASAVAPSFIEAIAGARTPNPSRQLIDTALGLLVRLEQDGVAVRLNLQGLSDGEDEAYPDYVVAGWVLPYVYALRGDRDWRRVPQTTGSRQVSPLAVQVAKRLDLGNAAVGDLKAAIGREVSEQAVLRAVHELWQQLRVIPVLSSPTAPALWQPLRQRFQKAIAEGASTSQVTAISVLASIYLQAVIASTMEEVELFLAHLTARSKIREVLRGLVATRQVHTTSLGASPHFYVAGTLPEFPATSSYSTPILGGYSRGSEDFFDQAAHEPAERELPTLESRFGAEIAAEVIASLAASADDKAPAATQAASPSDHTFRRPTVSGNGSGSSASAPAHANSRPAGARPGTSRPAQRPGARPGTRPPSARPGTARPSSARPGTAARPGSRPTTRPGARPTDSRSTGQRPAAAGNGSRPTGIQQDRNRPANGPRNAAGPGNGAPRSNNARPAQRPAGARPAGAGSARPGSARPGSTRPGSTSRPGPGSNTHPGSSARPAGARPAGARPGSSARPAGNGLGNSSRKPSLTGGNIGAGKRFAFSGARKQNGAKPPARTQSRPQSRPQSGGGKRG